MLCSVCNIHLSFAGKSRIIYITCRHSWPYHPKAAQSKQILHVINIPVFLPAIMFHKSRVQNGERGAEAAQRNGRTLSNVFLTA